MKKIKKIIKRTLSIAANPRYAHAEYKKAYSRLRTNKERKAHYSAWYNNQKISEKELVSQKKEAKKLAFRPLISILVPTYNTNPKHLRECLDSVLSQTYDNWELCISDDASTSQETKEVIQEYSEKYSSIKAVFNKKNGHIAVSSNIALDTAKGEYISLLDHDDLLEPNALFETVKIINKNPKADLIYSDEDKLEDDTIHVEPFFKPAWSPDFLNSCNYITHFATLSTRIMKKVGGFTPGTQGAQDWDLFFKITENTDQIYHIPKILYNWRKSETSTAQSADSKPYAYSNQKRVLRESIVRKKLNASVENHVSLGFWHVKYGIEKSPLVSIIIPTKDSFEYIEGCVSSILNETSYPYFEIIIVDTGSTDKKVLDYYKKITDYGDQIKIVTFKENIFNFSNSCNYGVEKSKGEYLIFLNNDTSIISPDWIQGLLGHAQRPENGMVGAKLLFPDESIQHAGVVLSERDVAFHPFYGKHTHDDILTYIYLANVRNVSAVTAACSMVSRQKFNEVGGFDEKLRVTYNDVDLCLRLLAAGYNNVYNPHVQLFHFESISVGKVNTEDRDKKELFAAQELMKKRWATYLKNDQYYSPNFNQYGPGYEFNDFDPAQKNL